MAKMILAFVASAVFCATSVSALCDNTTNVKMQECVFKTDLFIPAGLPKNEDAVKAYCSGNSTVNCVSTATGECTNDERNTKLINNLLQVKAIVDGQKSLCNATVLRVACYPEIAMSTTQNCLKAAVGDFVNVGDSDDLKKNLDDMCKFFDAYTKCFTDNCADLKAAMNGIKYRYCMKTEDEKKAIVAEYETGSASFLSVSLMAVITAVVASFAF